VNTYAQFGEDTIVAEILAEIGTNNRWCFEVGAHNGRFISNTLAFREIGWRAVLAESHPEHAAKLIEDYGKESHCIHGTIDNLDVMLGAFGAPRDIDFGVIDVDGADYWLWHDMEEFRPRVLVIEYNPYTNQKHYDPANPIGRGKPGQTAKIPLLKLAESKGYGLENETFCNLIFVDLTQRAESP